MFFSSVKVFMLSKRRFASFSLELNTNEVLIIHVVDRSETEVALRILNSRIKSKASKDRIDFLQ